MCLAQFMDQYGITLIAIIFTLAALGFSIFGSIYSNLVQNERIAEINKLQSNKESRLYWVRISRHFRDLARSRAYSTNLCAWSLLFAIVTLVLYLISAPSFSGTVINWFCVGTFSFAVMFLGISVSLAAFYSGSKKTAEVKVNKLCRCLLKLLGFLWKLFVYFWKSLYLQRPANPDVKKFTKDYSGE
jgi:hypothetical protein